MKHRSGPERLMPRALLSLLGALLLCAFGVAPARRGDAQTNHLWDLRYDQQTYLGTHNSYASTGHEYVKATSNQTNTIEEQLDRGVRAFMFDIYLMRQHKGAGWDHETYKYDTTPRATRFEDEELRICLAHEPDSTWGGDNLLTGITPFRPFVNALRDISNWMNVPTNPNRTAIITLVLESYVYHPDILRQTFYDGGMRDYLFYADRPNVPSGPGDTGFPAPDGVGYWDVRIHGWPKTVDMVRYQKRVVVFTSEDEDGMPYLWNHSVENVYGGDSLDPDTAWKNRGASLTLGDAGRPLFLMNYFPEFIASGPDWTGVETPSIGFVNMNRINDSKSIEKVLTRVLQSSIRYPNFLFVDHVQKGDSQYPEISGTADGPLEIVNLLNRAWPSGPEVSVTGKLTGDSAGYQDWYAGNVRARLTPSVFGGTLLTTWWTIIHPDGREETGFRGDGPIDLGPFNDEGVTLISFEAIAREKWRRSDRKLLRIKIDRSPPTVSATRITPPPNAAGWNNTAVLHEVRGEDRGVGIWNLWFRDPSTIYGEKFIPIQRSVLQWGVFADGETTVSYKATDYLGLESETRSFTVKVDRTAPTVEPVISPASTAEGWNRGPVTVEAGANDPVSGLKSLRYRLDNGALQEYTGAITVAGEGTHTVYFEAIDHADNVTVREKEIRIDMTVPVVMAQLMKQPNAAGWHREPVALYVVGEDPGGAGVRTLRYKRNPELEWSNIPSRGGRSEALLGFPEGLYQVSLEAEDFAGNVSPVHTLPVRVDATAPQTTAALSPAANAAGWRRAATTITLSGKDALSGIAVTYYRLNGGAVQPYTRPVVVSVQGPHTVEYWSVDVAGNEEARRSEAFRIDSLPPVVTAAATPSVLWPANGKLVAVTVSGQVTDAGSGLIPASARFTVTDEYGEIQPTGAVKLGANGAYSLRLSLKAFRKGNDKDGRIYRVVVSARDAADNTGSATATVTVPHHR